MCSMLVVQAAWSRSLCWGPRGSSRKWRVDSSRGGSKSGGTKVELTGSLRVCTIFAAVMQYPFPGSVFLALQHLEESLYLPQTRFDSEYMEGLLAPDYVEFGS